MAKTTSSQPESGVVAIFSVIFFMILVSVLTIGYLRIMVDEGRQANDNDLTSTALQAANAGVEDGKRILLHCKQPGLSVTQLNECTTALATTTCPGSMTDSLATELGISGDRDATSGTVRISSEADYQEHYTCLIVNDKTDDYVASLQLGQSVVVPLSAVSDFNGLEVAWHRTAASEGEGPVIAYPAPGQLPTAGEWAANRYPGYVRIEYFDHAAAPAPVSISQLAASQRTAFLLPTHPTAGGTNAVALNAIDQKVGDLNKVAPTAIRCSDPGSTAVPYACRVGLELPQPVTSAKQAYVRITPLYGNTHIQLRLYSGSYPITNVVQFDGTQPLIDVTGKSNDVFRRVQSRVVFGQPTIPEAALQSGEELCKDFFVSLSPADFEDSCAPTPSPLP